MELITEGSYRTSRKCGLVSWNTADAMPRTFSDPLRDRLQPGVIQRLVDVHGDVGSVVAHGNLLLCQPNAIETKTGASRI